MFRKEVLDKRLNLFYSKVNLASRKSDTYLISFFLSVVILLTLFITIVKIPKIESVKGYLYPSNGLITIVSNCNGIIDYILDDKTERISTGKVLSIVNTKSWQRDGISLDEELLVISEKKKKVLENKLNEIYKLKDSKIKSIKGGYERRKLEIKKIDDNINIIKDIIKNLEKNRDAYTKLNIKGYASKEKADSVVNNLLRYKQDIEELNLLKIRKNNEMFDDLSSISEIEVNYDVQRLDINNSILDIQKSISVIQSDSEKSIVSNVNGMIVTSLKKKGEYVKANEVIMTILPSYSKLDAKLLVPSKSIGLINKGHEVKLKFDAFPFQRFGIQKGKVIDIGKSILLPSDIKNNPISMSESFYQVVVELDSQSILAYGDKYMFEPGMTLDAEIILERLTIIDRILDPVRAVKGSFE
ncbi:Colicin V secretion protein CvaA [Vibrio vulnificus]|uniref:HlyD family secretion protein n=1 Tax=Vibrio vulnificus TaxID=672 RepID=UPI000928FCB8|nr:HlyD family efflux transporter periplasmic adaptor subunit [Vibrio vulnificus]OJI32406.1 Colicin V secretion protein CvaA [Vibrio vulnificus]